MNGTTTVVVVVELYNVHVFLDNST